MDIDNLIFGAFCLFLLLLGIRIWHSRKEKSDEPSIENNTPRRRIIKIIQWIVLFGLLIYMLPLMCEDLSDFTKIKWDAFFLRCLIFVITIYMLALNIKGLWHTKKK